MKAHGWASCSVQPSFSMLSSFFFQPLPIRYTQGGGQKNLNQHKRALKKPQNNTQTNGALGIVPHGPLLIAVRLLCNFCVQYEHRLVVFVLQVIPHSLPEMRGKEHTLYTTCTQHVHKSGLHFQCVGGVCTVCLSLPRQTLRSLTKLPAQTEEKKIHQGCLHVAETTTTKLDRKWGEQQVSDP